MSKLANPISPNQARLIDGLLAKFCFKSDIDLSRAIDIAPPVISRVRNGKAPVTPMFILAIHESLGVPVAEIRKEIAA